MEDTRGLVESRDGNVVGEKLKDAGKESCARPRRLGVAVAAWNLHACQQDKLLEVNPRQAQRETGSWAAVVFDFDRWTFACLVYAIMPFVVGFLRSLDLDLPMNNMRRRQKMG